MKRRIVKNIVAVAICLATMLSSFLTVFAGTVPASYDYDEYKTNGTVDYKKVHGLIFQGYGATAPKAKFEVHVKHGTETKVNNSDTGVVEVNIGDTLTIFNKSELGSGDDWAKCDFQVSDGTTVDSTTSISGITLSGKIDTSMTGTYHVYLNIMDNEGVANSLISTEGWGNWSYNGTHHVVGLNPGAGTGSGFDCWWYYAKMTIKVVNNPPNPDFTIQYVGVDITDNSGDPVPVSGDYSLVLSDKSTPFSSAEPITDRKWYYWSVTGGWKEVPYSTNKTTVNIASVNTALSGSGINKAFKLVCTSSTGGSAYKEHTAYFEKTIGTPYGYIVYYKDVDTEKEVATSKVVEVASAGTYVENALAKPPANGTLVTPSPQSIVLTSAVPKGTITFFYKFTVPPEPPSSNDPTAILETPEEVMAGAVVKADGSKSWSNNEGGYIDDYYFEYVGANLESDNNSNVRIWYPATGTYEVYLQVEDEEGAHDAMENEIKVIPPTPTANFTVTGKLKENRKVTVNSSASTSTKYYPIDTTKTIWTITPISGGTATDIKHSGLLTGTATKDILFKKAGTYRISLRVTNTYGLSASVSQTITIAPDLPPVAEVVLPTPAGIEYTVYRDPNSSNNATIEIFNESYSPDGDIINKAVAMYCYDSDNDGSYTDEQWYYSKDGTTWQSTGMNYANTVSSFNIYNIATSNVGKFVLKSTQVGQYWHVIRVMEAIPTSETIPSFIIESDYRRDDSF